MKDLIESKLSAALRPVSLVVIDESAAHHGHAGWRPGGETHFKVEIMSDAFEGKSRLERQRLIHELLADELKDQVHALSLILRTPSEASGDG